MPLARLRLIDVKEKDEEDLLQEVISAKVMAAPPEREIYRQDVPDIKSPEEEAEWQEKINKRTRRAKGASEDIADTDEEAATLPTDDDAEEPATLEEVASSQAAFCDSCDSKGVKHKKNCPKQVK